MWKSFERYNIINCTQMRRGGIDMKITFKDEEIKVEDFKLPVEIWKKEIEEANRSIIACNVNNEVKSLNHQLKDGDKVSFITRADRDGNAIYIRGVLYIMAMAFHKVFPKVKLTVKYQLSGAMLCEAEDGVVVTDEMLAKVKKEMQKIIDKDLPIKKIEMTKEEAFDFYEKEKTLRGKLQLDNKIKDEVCLYFCDEYYNYFYGVMPVSTGYISLFDIENYKDGFLVRYPSRKEPDSIKKYKETKKLHRTLEEYEDIHRVLKINTVYRLNKKITEGKQRETILLAEALHEKKIAEIANQIVKKKGVRVILIAGPSSSGKTTFAKRLGIQMRLNGFKPVTISVDNYFVERPDTPRDENGDYNFECIEAIDLRLFNDHLKKLLAGKEIEVPTFDFYKGTKVYKGDKMTLAEDEVLVIEGIHCLNDKLTAEIPKELKYKIYISALTVLNIDNFNRISTTDTRLIRRIVRDYQFRGYNASHTLKSWESVNKGERLYIFPFQEEADSMFNSSLVYELAALRKEAIPLLKKVSKEEAEYAEAKRLIAMLQYFESVDSKFIPKNSLLQEFLGDSIFDY